MTIRTMEVIVKDKDEEPALRTSSLTVTRGSIKSRSSTCLADPTMTPWLPGFHLAAQTTTNNEWTNFRLDRPFRDDGSSQSNNSNFGPSGKVSSDKQRLKGSRRKKRGGKKDKRDKNASNLENGKDDDQLSPLGRKVIVFVAVSLLLLCILLVGVTLRLGPVIDEMVRKGNEEIYRSMSAGASTSSPTTEDGVVANNTTPSSGTPG